MSNNNLLDRPGTSRRLGGRPTPAPGLPATTGSYVDADGARRTPERVGRYVGPSSRGQGATGSYTDRDGQRPLRLTGTYVRTQR